MGLKNNIIIELKNKDSLILKLNDKVVSFQWGLPMKWTGYIISIFLLINFFGCAAPIKYVDAVQPTDITQSNVKNISTKVLANAEEWRNSGVILKKGIKYKIKAEGKWRIDSLVCPWAGPDGRGCFEGLCVDLRNAAIVKGWSDCTLIGKIGTDGEPFPVGDEYEFVAPEDGTLFLRINESWPCGDNQGYVTAETTVVESYADVQNVRSEPSTADQITQEQLFPADSGQQWAVIIGISEYRFSGKNGLKNLVFADDDAKAFTRALKNLGWNESHIKLLINKEATKRNIEIALESWLTKAGTNDQIVLFWAGHGYPDPEDPEKVYFACYDTDITIPATGYRMDRVRTALEERRPKNVVLFADTCHAGKIITRGDRGIAIIPQINKMRREESIPKGWVFMVGADTDRQAIEHSSWTNGAFTHSLIQGLSGKADGYESAGAKDGIITMGELRAYLNSAMPEETQKVLGVAKRAIITTSSGDPNIWILNLQSK